MRGGVEHLSKIKRRNRNRTGMRGDEMGCIIPIVLYVLSGPYLTVQRVATKKSTPRGMLTGRTWECSGRGREEKASSRCSTV